MYVEFQLPAGVSTRVMSEFIKSAVTEWAKKYQVPDSDYSQKTIKYTHRLGFNKEKYFSLFSMTWDGFEYQIVRIENERY
jgi:hypothetical protein